MHSIRARNKTLEIRPSCTDGEQRQNQHHNVDNYFVGRSMFSAGHCVQYANQYLSVAADDANDCVLMILSVAAGDANDCVSMILSVAAGDANDCVLMIDCGLVLILRNQATSRRLLYDEPQGRCGR